MEADRDGLLGLLHQQLKWYPRIQVRDVYKLIYQGAMGPEHMVATQQEFARRLETEFGSLHPARRERLLEAVRADQSLFRLNLRPYKARKHSVDGLVPVLLQTSRQTHGSMEALVGNWDIFVTLCERGEAGSIDYEEVRSLSRWLEHEGYPAVHHSQVYQQVYQPAYRLIAAELTPQLGLSHAG